MNRNEKNTEELFNIIQCVLIILYKLFLNIILFIYNNLKRQKHTNIISQSDLDKTKRKDLSYNNSLQLSHSMPYGVSRISKTINCSKLDKRLEHSLFIASTGHGKTTMMTNCIRYNLIHNEPVIVIDPKGDIDLKNRIKKYCNYYSRIFHEFSISNPNTSESYNPLKNGSVTEIRDRLITSLNWSEEYYKRKALEYLDKTIPALKVRDGVVTLSNIRTLINKVGQHSSLAKSVLSGNLNKMSQAEDLSRVLAMDNKLLSGLSGQLSALDNHEYGCLLSPSSTDTQIDLINIIKKNEVIYFDTNIQLSRESSISTSKLILEDIKSISGAISSGKVQKPRCVNVYIDEANSILPVSFIDFLTKCRSSKFSVNLYSQSIASFDELGTSFKAQLIECTATKFIGRQDDPKSVDYLSAMAGSYDSVQESFQVKNNLFLNKETTGLGNYREAKKMRLEHDVIKQLPALTVVVLKKNPFHLDLIDINTDW